MGSRWRCLLCGTEKDTRYSATSWFRHYWIRHWTPPEREQ